MAQKKGIALDFDLVTGPTVICYIWVDQHLDIWVDPYRMYHT